MFFLHGLCVVNCAFIIKVFKQISTKLAVMKGESLQQFQFTTQLHSNEVSWKELILVVLQLL